MKECPNCHAHGMPAWSTSATTTENARCCFKCGHIEEKHPRPVADLSQTEVAT